MKTAVEEYLEHQKKRVEAGIIQENTYERKAGTLRNHLIPCLGEESVVKTRQINEVSFQNYLVYRRGKN